MALNSKIEWTDHTFNPWIGCTKVSPGCANCYAAVSTRARVLRAAGHETWGKGAPRSRTKTWGEPLRWNRLADPTRDPLMAPARRPRVFCASLADWLDPEVPVEWLSDLLYLIIKTSHLDWLLLTKRPQLWRSRLQSVARESDMGAIIASHWLAGNAPPNLWIGTTVEDQQRADERIPRLLEIPARVRFLSCEPLLGPVDLNAVRYLQGTALTVGEEGGHEYAYSRRQMLHWVIAGGESGPGARPMHPEWARSLRDQCQAAGVPFLFKQWGDWHPDCLCPGKGHADRTIARPSPGLRGVMFRCGKSAGRLLDGREWNEFPAVSQSPISNPQ